MRLITVLLATVATGCDAPRDDSVRCFYSAEVSAPFDTTYSGVATGIRGLSRYDADGEPIAIFEMYLGARRSGDSHFFALAVPTVQDGGDDVAGTPPLVGTYPLGVSFDEAARGMAFVGLSRWIPAAGRARLLQADRGTLTIESSSVEAVRGRFSGRFVEVFYVPPEPGWTADTTEASGVFVVIPGRGPGSAPETQRSC